MRTQTLFVVFVPSLVFVGLIQVLTPSILNHFSSVNISADHVRTSVPSLRVWPEYPRPNFVRSTWTNLNGLWDYAIRETSSSAHIPSTWDGQILVPFPLESKLSGVMRELGYNKELWYRRKVDLKLEKSQTYLLHFEAIDYSCKVWLNRKLLGSHDGGFTAFSFDLGEAAVSGTNELIVMVLDSTSGFQLRGKQTANPQGIWYTSNSGIWQTVWLEPVSSKCHLEKIDFTTLSLSSESAELELMPSIRCSSDEASSWSVEVRDIGEPGIQILVESEFAASPDDLMQTLSLANPKAWTPQSPHLYDLVIRVKVSGVVVDEVISYVGLRMLGRRRDADGHLKFTLNDQIVFHYGTLDQGWWPSGLLSPPNDTALRGDVQFLKDSGFNMIRKHIKVEPRRFYYHCDQIGMLVWQDQVSGGDDPSWTRLQRNPKDAYWPDSAHESFMKEFDRMVSQLYNHPSIVMWVPFNEAWGQHRSIEVGEWIVARDPSRLVNIASGGNWWPVGHVVDDHHYPNPTFSEDSERFDEKFVKVVGEFGGHGLAVKGHLWRESQENWGYGQKGLSNSAEELLQKYNSTLQDLLELKHYAGIAGGVYTQTTDVETELNGLMTYDREVVKIPARELRKLHSCLFRQ